MVFLFHLPTHDWYMYSFQNERTHKTLLPDRQAGGWRELFLLIPDQLAFYFPFHFTLLTRLHQFPEADIFVQSDN